ncbi:MAG: cytochrome b [Hyphomicrobiales bacterium]
MSDASPVKYKLILRLLHWAMATLIILLVPLGFMLENLAGNPLQGFAYDLHKSLGISIFILAVVRIGAKLVVGVPDPEPSLPRLQKTASKLVHGALYGLVFLVPVFGYLGTSMCCSPIWFFWIWEVPIRIEGGKDLASAMFKIHEIASITLAGLAGLHITAALYHVFIRKDGVFARMALYSRQQGGAANKS